MPIDLKTNYFYQAYYLLRSGYVFLPIVAGLDKFTDILTSWEIYLSPVFLKLLPITPTVFMRGIGVIEIIAGLLVALKPRLGAYIVFIWLWLIIINLFLLGDYFDIALRDFVLALGALALARMAAGLEAYERI